MMPTGGYSITCYMASNNDQQKSPLYPRGLKGERNGKNRCVSKIVYMLALNNKCRLR